MQIKLVGSKIIETRNNENETLLAKYYEQFVSGEMAVYNNGRSHYNRNRKKKDMSQIYIFVCNRKRTFNKILSEQKIMATTNIFE